ncbi:MAG TPA: cation-translocating P-type ATPase [Blastocatellia bacterium]|nr:cation-translocating P-type ATPase [Blastocatellia bacterium]
MLLHQEAQASLPAQCLEVRVSGIAGRTRDSVLGAHQSKKADRMINEFDLSEISGLSDSEATERLNRDGFNDLPSTQPRDVLAIAFDVVREPMFLLLVACGAIYLILGDPQEAFMLLGFVFFIMGITLYQERKTERTLEALRDLSSPRALVIRNGQQRRIAGRDVVRGDILLIAEGDRIPADSTVLSCGHFMVDESALTGESVPVRKIAAEGAVEIGPPGGDNLPFIYSGTLVVACQAVAKALATGQRTEVGKIGRALQKLEIEQTPLQKETDALVRKLAVLGIVLCVVVVIVYGLTRANWFDGFLAGITLAMAILPNEFPVVLTIFLALGAWRISRKNVLTRRMPAVETLGSATVLCVDKTGTLTMNHMSVAMLFANGEFHDVQTNANEELPEEFHELSEFAILASHRDPFDPIEKALRELGNYYLSGTEHLHDDWALVREYPLSNELMALSLVWHSPDGEDYVIAAKGAPEAIFDLCHFDESQLERITAQVVSLANEGLRVLGVARSYFRQTGLPTEQHDFDFEFLGLVGLTDPVRPTVPEAIRECYGAGVRVVMITGDYAGTASNVANQIGLTPGAEIITGPELDGMSDFELQRRISSTNIFARVVPEQKLRLVMALKANGEIVAMTGDGVNDAPALKAAHIGIAMGERGTDVAREASSLVLLDDDFSSIVQAVRQGRRVFDNLRKGMAYILAIHVPIAGMTLIPVVLNWPLVLLPVHIAFLHLIIDPACSIVFEAEPEEKNVMSRPPRGPDEPLFGRRTWSLSLFQGLGVLVILAALYAFALYRGLPDSEARALAFTTLIIANIGLILINRSWAHSVVATLRSPNAALWWVIGGAAGFLGLVLYVPALRELFRFAELHLIDLGICLVAGAGSLLWFEAFKLLSRGRARPTGHPPANTEGRSAGAAVNPDR